MSCWQFRGKSYDRIQISGLSALEQVSPNRARELRFPFNLQTPVECLALRIKTESSCLDSVHSLN
jgi:hypothetical protein